MHTHPPKLTHIHIYVCKHTIHCYHSAHSPNTLTLSNSFHWFCHLLKLPWQVLKQKRWLNVKGETHATYLFDRRTERERESDDRAVCMNCVSSEFRLSTHSDREIKNTPWYVIMKIRSCPVPLSDWTIWYLFSDASYLIYLLMLWASHSQNWQSWTVEPIC